MLLFFSFLSPISKYIPKCLRHLVVINVINEIKTSIFGLVCCLPVQTASSSHTDRRAGIQSGWQVLQTHITSKVTAWCCSAAAAAAVAAVCECECVCEEAPACATAAAPLSPRFVFQGSRGLRGLRGSELQFQRQRVDGTIFLHFMGRALGSRCSGGGVGEEKASSTCMLFLKKKDIFLSIRSRNHQ